MTDFEPVVGIDLGTTNSVAAVYFPTSKKTEVIHNHGSLLTRSCVYYKAKNQEIVGKLPTEAMRKPQNFIFSTKRFMGKKFDDKYVQEDITRLPFKVIKGEKEEPSICVSFPEGEEHLWPQQVGARVLQSLKTAAEKFLSRPVKNAVITVPAYFGDQQIQATKEAGQIVGFNVLRILTEPTAAALAYGFQNQKEGKKNILVFDLGGGTFDVTVLKSEGATIEVEAIGGDVHLGGDDWDYAILKDVCADLKAKGFDVPSEKSGKFLALLEECRKVKECLTQNTTWDHDFECIESYSKHFSRVQMETLTKPLFDRCMTQVKDTLNRAKLSKEAIDEVLLVGGSTKMPKIRELLKEFFGKEPCGRINPDEIVAIGAAIQGAALILPPEKKVGSDLASVVVFDKTAISYGVEVKGCEMSIIIPRDSPVPFENTGQYTPMSAQSTSVNVRIFQGENSLTKENDLIGQLEINGIPTSFLPVPTIVFHVKFKVDVNRILYCHVLCPENPSLEKNLTINLDQKGSMTGQKVEDARKAMKQTEDEKKEKEKIIALITEMLDMLEIHEDQSTRAYAASKKSENDPSKDLPSLQKLESELRSYFKKKNMVVPQANLWDSVDY